MAVQFLSDTKQSAWNLYVHSSDQGVGGSNGCTPKVRHEIKGPITLNGGEQCLCPDNSIPVN